MMAKVFRFAVKATAVLFAVAVALFVFLFWLGARAETLFGQCKLQVIERSIGDDVEIEYLDACMASSGYQTSRYCTYNAGNVRFPSCYYSNITFWLR